MYSIIKYVLSLGYGNYRKNPNEIITLPHILECAGNLLRIQNLKTILFRDLISSSNSNFLFYFCTDILN